MSAEADLIVNELVKANQEFDLGLKQNNTGLWVRCPFHSGGREKTPSLRITIDDGSSYFQRCKCHGCQWAGHYNELAQHWGLLKTDRNFKAVGTRKLGFQSKLAKKRSKDEGRDFVRSTFKWPEDREWRQIPGKIVIRNKAELTETRHDLEEPRLAFPVTLWGEVKGYVYAVISDLPRDIDGNKIGVSYINSPGPWKEQCLFGFDAARKALRKHPEKPLWVVEGPRDRLWLQTAGCIVVSLLGSSVSKDKVELLKILNPQRILVATDNDAAGNKAALHLLEHLDGILPLTRIKWKVDTDPCDYSLERLKQINHRYYKK